MKKSALVFAASATLTAVVLYPTLAGARYTTQHVDLCKSTSSAPYTWYCGHVGSDQFLETHVSSVELDFYNYASSSVTAYAGACRTSWTGSFNGCGTSASGTLTTYGALSLYPDVSVWKAGDIYDYRWAWASQSTSQGPSLLGMYVYNSDP